MSDLATRERLKAAIGTGELVGIFYDGGSQPGAFREITPQKVDDRHTVAFCHHSLAVKTFRLDQIRLVSHVPSNTEKEKAWSSQAAIEGDVPIEHLHASLSDYLGSLGWHVSFTADTHDKTIGLCGFFKNGKPRKSATISLSYAPVIRDPILDPDHPDDIRWEERPSVRPWRLMAEKSGNFENCVSVVRRFLDAAEASAGSEYKSRPPRPDLVVIWQSAPSMPKAVSNTQLQAVSSEETIVTFSVAPIEGMKDQKSKPVGILASMRRLLGLP